MTVEQAAAQTLNFQAEVKQLLHLMIHSLYSNREIFLRELVSNASDACDKLRFEALENGALFEDDAELKIRVAYDKAARSLTISDNGIGIEDNIKAKIFEPFFTTKPTAEAAGVGLYLCREVILNHQGSIIVKSEKDNVTEFMITIPIYQKSNNNE